MLDLRSFPLSDSAKDKIRTTVNHLYRLSGIETSGGPSFDVKGVKFLDVQLIQHTIANGKILSEDALISKGATIFEGCLSAGIEVRISVIALNK